jgi:hypothetical protein
MPPKTRGRGQGSIILPLRYFSLKLEGLKGINFCFLIGLAHKNLYFMKETYNESLQNCSG